ncbi:putative plant SNARE [Musa troglodytarum]|uniref:Plant SNARE n=1 Tax=Musa troglodytarum TaxID=320322 RepID=A0A9E7F0M2_9LILI|nr:putative plant SNARE [Musa troglodytarum]URD87559.1 putative plant SNARE [Musa troglodytarum]URD87560.1 putative plant SNARE [Musa troglodytarum]URD87561.1 putative plant SNARE [Musa troglodytarum]URD87562.1 putative plant SNARE [Musa troglodytarum]
MASGAPISTELEQIDGEIQDIFRALHKFIALFCDADVRFCWLIKEFDCEIKDQGSQNILDVSKQLNEKKQTMIKELNSYVAMRKTYQNCLGN